MKLFVAPLLAASANGQHNLSPLLSSTPTTATTTSTTDTSTMKNRIFTLPPWTFVAGTTTTATSCTNPVMKWGHYNDFAGQTFATIDSLTTSQRTTLGNTLRDHKGNWGIAGLADGELQTSGNYKDYRTPGTEPGCFPACYDAFVVCDSTSGSTSANCNWAEHSGYWISGWTSLGAFVDYATFDEAKTACFSVTNCGGIIYTSENTSTGDGSYRYQPRMGTSLNSSNESGLKTYLKPTDASCTPAIGTLSQWSGWGSCSVDCDGGTQERTRTCSNNNCNGSLTEQQVCNAHACLVNECDDGTHNCNDYAHCLDKDVGFDCECHDGFIGDGLTCDRDCAWSEYERIWLPGWTSLGEFVDYATFDEAKMACFSVTDCGGITYTSENTSTGDGSYRYQPRAGTQLNAGGEPGSMSYVKPAGGSAPCPINECENGTHNCDENASCSDTDEGFKCECNEGLVGDGVTCNHGRDCYDGNNGMCSHFCTPISAGVVECTCPPCWTASDGMNCEPAVDRRSVSCSGSQIHVSIDECVYNDQVDLGWQNDVENDCGFATHNGTMWEFTTPLGGCNTAQTTNDGVITFENVLVVKHRHSLVTMYPDPEIPFSCNFESEVQDITMTHGVEHPSAVRVQTGTSGSGSFDFEVATIVMESGNTYSDSPSDDVITVGEQLHFRVTQSDPVDGVSFFIKKCTVSDGTNEFDAIDSNCGQNAVHTTIEPATSDDSGLTSIGAFTAFTFSNQSNDELELTCTVVTCLQAECASLMGDCGNRKRREVPEVSRAQLYTVKTSFTQK